MIRVKSLRELRKLLVQIQRAGSHYKARFAGHSTFTFGATPEEARQRLLKTPSSSVKDSQRNAEVRKRNFFLDFRGVHE